MPSFDPIIMYIVFTIGIPVGAYFTRSLIQRIAVLEENMQHTITEPQVRQFFQDKYDPIREDIKEIKEMQQKLFDVYLTILARGNQDE